VKVMLVGGGRWGRVHAGVLVPLLPTGSQILWVSRHGQLMQPAAAAAGSTAVTPLVDLDQALRHRPDAAIIATAARTHAQVSRQVLEHGVPALVEKPFVLDTATALDLVALANSRGLVLCVGLHLFFASYLRHFRSLWQHRTVATVRLTWLDCERETRHGEAKRADLSMPIVHDIFPHLWTMLRVLFPGLGVSIGDAEVLENGHARLIFSAEDLAISAHIGRRSPNRARRIELKFRDGGTAAIDFTIEPGSLSLDGQEAPGDPTWGHAPSPLSAEVAGFLAAVNDRSLATDLPCLAGEVLDSVRGAEAATAKLAAAAVRRLAQSMPGTQFPTEDPGVCSLLIDNLAPELGSVGVRIADPAQCAMLVQSAVSQLSGGGASMDGVVSEEISGAVARSEFLRQVAFAIRSGV
jgi:predicted dehydrogenase